MSPLDTLDQHMTIVCGEIQICMDSIDYFNNGQYLLGDLAFQSSRIMVLAFKKPPGQELGADESQFNTMLAKGHIKVEHCIGILKGRFQRLRN